MDVVVVDVVVVDDVVGTICGSLVIFEGAMILSILVGAVIVHSLVVVIIVIPIVIVSILNIFQVEDSTYFCPRSPFSLWRKEALGASTA